MSRERFTRREIVIGFPFLITAFITACSQNITNPQQEHQENSSEIKNFHIEGYGKSKELPCLSITNCTPHTISINLPFFKLAVKETFIKQPQLFEQMTPTNLKFKLLPQDTVGDYSSEFLQVKIDEQKQILIATGLCLPDIKNSHLFKTPADEASKFLTYYFVEGIYCWAVENNLCSTNKWNEIKRYYFNALFTFGKPLLFATFPKTTNTLI
jgi:hypothetical protein